ncbi:MAG: glycosyltransferase family 2 protein [Chloroflexia bacterium]
MTGRGEPMLTIAALAHNEAGHIPACVDSVRPLKALFGAEVLVVLDSRADEATERAAREWADRVVVSPFVNFSAQRNRTLDLATGEWVFFIDPDERCTPALAEEIARAVGEDGSSAYRIPRRNYFFGREVRHTGWWPDYQIRLLRRAGARYDEAREVHELPMVDGEIGTLRQPLIHYNYATWRQFFSKQWRYAPYEARALYAAGSRARPRSLLGQPLRELKRRLVDYQGYKDGLLGLALSIAMCLYTAETYRQLRRLQRGQHR